MNHHLHNPKTRPTKICKVTWMVLASGLVSLALGLVLSITALQGGIRSGSTYVTGIGGVFFKVNDPEQFRAWYKKHLGIRASASGANFFWRKSDDPQSFARTVWTPFPQNSDYFGPGAQQIMINYRVRELDALLNKLTAAGVEQVGKVEEYWYGRFAWIIDGEGNRVELWEPVDLSPDEFERRLEQQQKQRDE